MSLFRSRFNNTPSAVIHSNGYAEAADKNQPTFGAVSPETFSQRQSINRNRQHVNNFQSARIHYDYRAPRTASPSQPDQAATSLPSSTVPPRPSSTTISRPSGAYRESSSRGFNPYR